jgi:hypothetical protein
MICQGDIYWIDLGQPIGSESAYLKSLQLIKHYSPKKLVASIYSASDKF